MSQGKVAGSGSKAYSGGHEEYRSGAVDGPGAGNKTAPGGDDVDTSDTRLGTADVTSSYTGGTKYGSAPISGPGAGNKLEAVGDDSGDSKLGKLMEKTGGALKNEKLVSMGQEKRGSQEE